MSPETAAAERFSAILEEVFEPLQRYLRRRASPADAEDLLSEVLMIVWRRMDDAPSHNPLPWCYGIARRCLSNQRRAEQRRLRLADRVAGEPVSTGADPADQQPDPDLLRALGALDPEERDLLHLWAWEGLEAREIAVVLGSTANAASLRLARARKKLARELERQSRPLAGHKGVKDTRWASP